MGVENVYFGKNIRYMYTQYVYFSCLQHTAASQVRSNLIYSLMNKIMQQKQKTFHLQK